MGFRERLSRQSPILVGVIVVVLLGILWFSFSRSGTTVAPTLGVAYTVDDGKTFFIETQERVSPFDKDGKPAVLAHLYQVGGSGPKFVGWVERFDAASVPILQRALTAKRGTPESILTTDETAIVGKGRQFKLVGDTDWKRYDPMGVSATNDEVAKRHGNGPRPLPCDPESP